jgi:hypothetical protein
VPEELNEKRRRALLESVVKARADFESLQDDADAAKRGYYESVRALHESGMALREIARHLGLSHQRVHQILGMETPGKKKGSGRTLGAAGIVVALVLSTVALLSGRDGDPPPRTERVKLVNEEPFTRNDVRAALEYEQPLTSGTVDGVRWTLLTTTLNGIYCFRIEFSSTEGDQGHGCSRVPTSSTEGHFYMTTTLGSDAPGSPISGALAYGAVSSDTSTVLVETCEGSEKEVRTLRVPDARVNVFVAFLPAPANGMSLEARDANGRILEDRGDAVCPTAGPEESQHGVRPPKRVGPRVVIARGRIHGRAWKLAAYLATTRAFGGGAKGALCQSFGVGPGWNFDCFVGGDEPLETDDALDVGSYGAGGGQAIVGRVAPGVAAVEFRSLNGGTIDLQIYPSPPALDVDYDFYVGFIEQDDSGAVVALDAVGRVLDEGRVCCPLD